LRPDRLGRLAVLLDNGLFGLELRWLRLGEAIATFGRPAALPLATSRHAALKVSIDAWHRLGVSSLPRREYSRSTSRLG
jgi:hypothetical protein